MTANVGYVKRKVQLEPNPLPGIPAALKAPASSDAATGERAPGTARVAQVKPGA